MNTGNNGRTAALRGPTREQGKQLDITGKAQDTSPSMKMRQEGNSIRPQDLSILQSARKHIRRTTWDSSSYSGEAMDAVGIYRLGLKLPSRGWVAFRRAQNGQLLGT